VDWDAPPVGRIRGMTDSFSVGARQRHAEIAMYALGERPRSVLDFAQQLRTDWRCIIPLPETFLSGPLQDKSGFIWFTRVTYSRIDRATPGPPWNSQGKFGLSEDTAGDLDYTC